MDPRTRLLALLAPTTRPRMPADGPLRDEEAQLVRLEQSLAEAERAGSPTLVARLTVLRHAQQERVLVARRQRPPEGGVHALLPDLVRRVKERMAPREG